MTPPVIGVLALQGAFARHGVLLDSIGACHVEVRTPDELAEVDALVIPGGESTTMSMMLERSALVEPLRVRLADGLPAFGTCAGAILLASTILDGRDDQVSLGALDIEIQRNGYGRQVDSFEADIDIESMGPPPLRAVFIRAPRIVTVGSAVEVLAEFDGDPVLCRQGAVMASTFHPELGRDVRVHEAFVASLS